MQASQRAEWNHALEYAIFWANELKKPLLAFFGLTESFPEANSRHFRFLLEGLRETEAKLSRRGIQMIAIHGDPCEGVLRFSKEAALVVTDYGYLRIQREWRQKVAEVLPCALVAVESDVIVPVSLALPREAYSARILRPALRKRLSRFLTPLQENPLHFPSLSLPKPFDALDLSQPEHILSSLRTESIPPVRFKQGGTERAKERLREFIEGKLSTYAFSRNDPGVDGLSGMSPYLHFGQISPLFIALEVLRAEVPETHKETYLEELIVRRELSMNFTFYNSQYDSFAALPRWAQETLRKHRNDPRPYTYTLEELENARTHDPLWNAAQKELLLSGTIHGYVRMYWGKKILEWSKDPEEAFVAACYLNNKYALDGRDPNSFAGIAWCFGKHDRPFRERPVYGKVRPMTRGAPSSASKKAYIERVEKLANLLGGEKSALP
ncbi:MAG: deoxyribodipyrimidine photo-lyase [Candidatus Caldatribacterium sp.]|nr:deoxyribodipyrimidine photo-lyase [Candidatus Caldatribacterium sp.]